MMRITTAIQRYGILLLETPTVTTFWVPVA